MQVVGNVVGNTNNYFCWEREENGFGSAPWPLFLMGYPNMGNYNYSGTNPPISFNFPGKFYYDFVSNPQTNGIFTFTNTQTGTNLVGNFSNVPAPNSSNYPLKFQDSSNTNRYFPDDFDGQPVFSVTAGTTTNLHISRSITVSNGW